MRVWNSNAYNPLDIQKSVIPLPPTVSVVNQEDIIENTLTESAAYVRERGTKTRVQKRANDSVSRLNFTYIARFNLCE